MATIEQHGPKRRSLAASPALIVIVLLFAAIIINPFREMCALDDSWAYARMVHQLLLTGHYHLDPWAAPNNFVQIYLAAGLSKIFGYSLSLLRCSTLLLFAVALGSFYRLLRELGHPSTTASILTLAIAASPLVLLLAFTFMSDVQFLGWLLLALLLYFRGIRDRNALQIFLASLAATCAIGTRQFGIALVLALLAVWLWPSRDRLPAPLVLLGIAVPFFAAVAQLYAGFQHPNVTQILVMAETREFLGLPVQAIAREILWRCAAISQYIGISFLPLATLVFTIPRASWSKPVFRIPAWLYGVLGCAAILCGLAIASSIAARPEARHHGLATPLQLYWLLPTQFSPLSAAMWFFNIGGIAGGALLLVLCFKQIQRARASSHIRPEKVFLAATAGALLLMHLLYWQLNDTYITALIPFALLLVGESLRSTVLSRSAMRACALLSTVFILAVALWMHGGYARQQAIWNSADDLMRTGVQPSNVWAPYWAEYHGLFDEWVAAGTPGYILQDRHRYLHPPQDPYNIWRQSQWDHVPYRIMDSSDPAAPPGWSLMASRSYRSARFSRRFILTLKRDTALPEPGGPSSQ